MAKIHVLDSDNSFSYRAVIHYDIPSGNNTVGESWKSCALANGDTGSTILEVGTGPGDLTQTEYDSIIAGDIVEIVRWISPGLAPTNTAVEALCDVMISMHQADMGRILEYYGHTVAGT